MGLFGSQTSNDKNVGYELVSHNNISTLFVNESILDINYPELLTAVIYDINAYKKCLEKLI